MNAIVTVAFKELRDGLRNRWVVASTLLLAALALGLTLLGSAPTGTLGVSSLAVIVVSLASLSIFLIPLIALLLSYDALVGELERGTLLLLLSYPIARWQILIGKFLGHGAILAIATVLGYGAVGLVFALTGGGDGQWGAFAVLVGSSVLLGTVFVAMGYLVSAFVKSRGAAAGLAVAVWLLFVLLYDLVLLGVLVSDKGRHISTTVFPYLLLSNPADVYRLLNLTGFDAAREVSGMAGLAAATRFNPAALIAVLAGWIVIPLAAAGALFARREL